MFVCAALILLTSRSAWTSGVAALINVGSVAARPDSLIISFAIFAVFCIENRARSRVTITYFITYFAGLSLLFGYNYFTFNHVFPTPVRLKAFSGSDMVIKLKYVIKNLIFYFTPGQIWIGLFILIIMNMRRFLDVKTTILIAASCASVLIANINGDVFYGYRMMWTPALVLAFVVLQKSDRAFTRWTTGITGDTGSKPSVPTSLFLHLIMAIALALVALNFIEKNVKASVNTHYSDTEMSRQLAMAQWINSNLSPENGAIALFYGGTAYHLPKFEIADLLGKADEMIANSEPKWGSPGHNKWDFDLSIAKWNPQAIFVEAYVDPTKPESIIIAKQTKQTQFDGSYVFEVFLNEKIRANYEFCYLRSRNINDHMTALLIRNDIAGKLKETRSDGLSCATLAALN